MAEKSEEQIQAEEVIQNLRDKGIRLLAIDFDKTIISVHTGGMWRNSTPDLVNHFRPCFKALIEAALDIKEEDWFVCIVTYSMQPTLIKDLLKLVLPKSNVNRVIIRANSKDWLPHGSQSPSNGPSLGKQQHIAWICTHLYNTQRAMIEPHEIVLMDDDKENVVLAKDFGHNAFEVKQTVQMSDLQLFAKYLYVSQRKPTYVLQ